MEITARAVKELRERTGVGMMDCKKALQEAEGDLAAAEVLLRKQDKVKASKSAGRRATEGAVHAYIHAGGRLGVLLEVNCETDFAANSEEFKVLVNDLAMHIAASDPRFIHREQVGEELLAREREIYRAQVVDQGKPENIVDRIVEGKLKNFYAEQCLLDQPFVKDPSMTVTERIERTIGKIKENIEVARFERYQLGAAAAGDGAEA